MDSSDKKLDKIIGSNILKARKAKEMKQKELAFRVSISSSYLSHIENGRTVPSIETLFKISLVLGLEAKDLL